MISDCYLIVNRKSAAPIVFRRKPEKGVALFS